MTGGGIAETPASALGRDEDCAVLETSLDRLGRGERGAVMLRGNAGVGKTHLIRWLVDRAQTRGMRAVLLRPPVSMSMSFRDLASGLLAAMGDRSGLVARPGGTGAVIELAGRIDDLLGHEALLITVDDAQSLGAEVFRALIDAIRLTTSSVQLVAAWRNGPSDPAPDIGPVGDLPSDVLDLDGLDVIGVDEFAAALLRGPVVPSLVARLHDTAAGNPLFMLEILRYWQATGDVHRVGDHWVLAPSATPPGSLNEALRRVLSAFGNDELLIVRILAVLDRPASFEHLMTISGLDEGQLLGATQSLEGAGWIAGEPGPTGFSFRIAHERYAGTVRDHIDATAAAALASEIVHGIGDVLSVAEMAHHGLRALKSPQDLDAILNRAANEAEQTGSFKEAAGLWGTLAARAPTPREKVEAMLAQARATRRFDPRAAMGLLERIQTCDSDEDLQIEASVDLADLVALDGDRDAAIATVLDLVPRVDGHTRTRLEQRLAGLLISVGRIDEALPTVDRLAAEGSAIGYMLKAAIAAKRADFEEACRLNIDGLHHATDRSEELLLSANLAWAQIFVGEWDEAERTLASAIALARSSDEHVRLWRLQACAVMLDAWRGRTADAMDAGTSALRLARTLAPPDVHADVCNALAVALLEAGHPDQGIELLRELGLQIGGVPALRLADLALVTGDVQLATQAAQRAFATLDGYPPRAASLDLLRAEISLASGDPAAAVDVLEHWAEEPPPIALERARVHQVRAEALRRTRRRAQAVEAARKALAIYEHLGAVGGVGRVASWLQQHATASRPKRGPGEMTEREKEVLALAAQGLTNAEIANRLVLSPATVKKHVENILARTGAKRRSELHRFLNVTG